MRNPLLLAAALSCLQVVLPAQDRDLAPPDRVTSDRVTSDRVTSDSATSDSATSDSANTSSATPDTATPRNIVLILADDLGAEGLGCYGSADYDTPRLDALASEGLRFSQAHSQPLCTPTRVELLTGQCNVRNYVAFSVLPPGSRTFAHALGEQGLAAGVFGKWQLLAAEHYPEQLRGTGSTPQQAGFARAALWQVTELGSRYWGPRITYLDAADAELRTVQHDDEAFGPDLYTDALLDFVRAQHAAGERFLAYFPMALTHDPFVPAPGDGDAGSKHGPTHFASMVRHMDRLVGRIADTLAELDIAEDTLLVFVGDNGTHPKIRSKLRDGREVRGGKRSTLTTATHVPLIVHWPGTVAPGQVDDRLVHVRDLHRTLLDLTGAAVPAAVRADTVSLAPLLRGADDAPRREHIAFWYHPRPVVRPKSKAVTFAIDGSFKLYGDGRLFDTGADPMEEKPLAADAAAERRARLRAALDALPAR